MTANNRPSLKDPWIALATWFGSGYITPAPGTWGTLAALPFGLALLYFGGQGALLTALIVVTVIGLRAAAEFERQTGEDDSKHVVIDEVAGIWLALIPVGLNLWYIAAAIILFRILDVFKPWPIKVIDKQYAGAVAVMLDDLLAGLFTGLIIVGAQFAGLG